MEDTEKFKQRFTDLIEDLECKRYKIPSTIGIDYDTFLKITEYGKIPKPVVVMRIADYFQVSVDYLLGRTNNKFFEKTEMNVSFGDRYKELKQSPQSIGKGGKKWTDYAVASHLHISTAYITNWKKYHYIPSLDNLIILSELFGVSLDYLLGRTDDPTIYIDKY